MNATPAFEVRRSRAHGVIFFCGALGLFAFSLAFTWTTYQNGGSVFGALFLTALMGFYAAQSGHQLLDRRPLLIVGADGLGLAGATAAPLPWSRIWRLQAVRGLTGARIDIVLDAETFLGVKLGNRWMGDHVVKARHLINGFSILTAGFEHSGPEIEQAIRRYWPSPEQASEEDET